MALKTHVAAYISAARRHLALTGQTVNLLLLALTMRADVLVDPIANEANPSISEGVSNDDLPLTILNLRALALKRLAHLDELKRTGRWTRFFATEEAFEHALQNAVGDADRWKQLAYRITRPADDAAE